MVAAASPSPEPHVPPSPEPEPHASPSPSPDPHASPSPSPQPHASPSPEPEPHASPSPEPHAAAGRPHPTYTKMITHAVTELGGGAAVTRAAIADYILHCYSGLPVGQNHDALLFAHLRRLVAEGVLRTDGPHSSSYVVAPPPPPPPPPSEEKRGLGRPPRKDSDASTPAVGEKSGRGSPHVSSEMAALSAHTGAATPSVLPAKRKQPGSVLTEDDDSVAKKGPGKPSKEVTREAAFVQAGGEATQNGGDATPVPSGGASSTGIKRGRGRPRKEKPLAEAAAVSPESAPATGIKRGRGRPSKEKTREAALVQAGREATQNGGDATLVPSGGSSSTGIKRGRGRPRKEKPLAAAAAVSPESAATGVKRGRGRPSKEKTREAAFVQAGGEATQNGGDATPVPSGGASSTGIKRGCGRPRKEKPLAAAAVSPESAPATGVKRGRGRPSKEKTREAAFVQAGGEATQNGGDATPVPSGGSSSTGIKRGRGRPRKEKPLATAAAVSPESAVVTGVKRGRGRPSKEKTREAAFAQAGGEATQNGGDATPVPSGGASSTGIKRGRGRPRKEKPLAAAAVSPESAPATGVKRGRGRPSKEKAREAALVQAGGEATQNGGDARPVPSECASLTGIKRGRGRPRKVKPPAAAAAVSPESAPTRKEKPSQLAATSPRIPFSWRDFRSRCSNAARQTRPATSTEQTAILNLAVDGIHTTR